MGRNSKEAQVRKYAFGPIDSIPKFLWKARNRVIHELAAMGGRFLYKTHLLWLLDTSWLDPFEDHVSRYGMHIDRDLLERRFALSQLVKLTAPLRGSTAETGVLQGHGSTIISMVLGDTYAEGDRHYAFDSFEGLQAPREEDRTSLGWHWWRKGDFSEAPEDAVFRLLEPFPFVEIVKGWIPDSFAAVRDDEMFRLVHVDVDLYEATRDSIDFFYPRLIPGGMMIFDDYGFLSCPGAKKAADDFFAARPEDLIELPTGQAFVIRQGRSAP